MGVTLNKRNLRVLSITSLLLLLVFFVVQNANSVSIGESSSLANANSNEDQTLTSAGTSINKESKEEVVTEKQKAKEKQPEGDSVVDAEIGKIKQEVGIGKTDDLETGSSGSISGGGVVGKGGSASEHAQQTEFDPVKEYAMILDFSPIIVFSKSTCPYSKKLKELLDKEYSFTPSYFVIELDRHHNGAELQKYVEQKTGRSTVPNVIINGKSRGGNDEFRSLHNEGKLLSSFKDWSQGTFTVLQLDRPSNN
ncbi:hypothetical protein ZYGR_0A02160 [Zygosaccharomyces rouxii]|uniref:ZYRO0A04928p n=2 Tax=Zygosaccharomyces rouxii TaxID=4956 RepID=C5DPP0_ZYGRC|nr:uncharacterized protein ZYRO0A04928g [Zygosaccharomyces rouxii]KAH9198829.1 thioredoxin-like protein [Zygosaccharomyces rouxii]GAV46623.1 hypothetical protein ZYGR_0A02160 [Zygosaccharomyces rouxii]CAR25651.1 ZYRO0A04928p [Zygosaccharomyces rouxii]